VLERNRLLTLKEVADHLACSRRHVFFLIGQGRLRAVKLSPRATRVAASEVERFVADNTRPITPPKAPDAEAGASS
jgi:excisionase family DNA binding protein